MGSPESSCVLSWTTLLIGIALLGASVVQALTPFLWAPKNNTGSSNWSTNSNWSGSAVPTNDGTAIIQIASTTSKTAPVVDVAWAINALQFKTTNTAHTLSGQLLTIGAGGISQTTTKVQTVANAITLAANQTWSGTAGGLTLTGSTNLAGYTLNTVTSGTGVMTLGAFTGAGTLQVASGTTVTLGKSVTDSSLNLTLSGGTLKLNNLTQTFGNLNVTANSVIDFGTGGSVLSLTGITIASGVVLTVKNWADMADYFYSSGWTGATPDVSGVAPMNQVVFTGWNASATKWQGGDNQVTPTPESSTYGLGLMACLTLGVGLARRWRGSQ